MLLFPRIAQSLLFLRLRPFTVCLPFYLLQLYCVQNCQAGEYRLPEVANRSVLVRSIRFRSWNLTLNSFISADGSDGAGQRYSATKRAYLMPQTKPLVALRLKRLRP